MVRLAHIARLLACSAAVVALSAQELTFTRPTVIASPVVAPATWHDVILDDANYKIVSRHYGNGGTQIPGLFVFSKKRNAWIAVRRLSTEHAKLGRSPDFNDIPLQVGWNYSRLANQDYATLPLRTSGSINFPDRIVDVPAAAAYRFDFNSRLKREQSLTSFWVRVDDLEAAFEGGRRDRGL